MTDTVKNINELGSAFEEFKSANDQRLAAIESKGSADVLLTEKVDRINDALSDIEKKIARPSGIKSDVDQAELEHKNAFNVWARKGNEGDLEAIERKAITLSQVDANANASGGFLLPEQVEAGIREDLRTLSPIRSRSTVITVSGDDYRFMRNLRGLTTGWVGETDPRPETATPKLSETKVPMGELYANPAVSQRALDDTAFDLEAWLQQNISDEFAIEENKQFAIGDGVNKPQGFLTTTGLTTVKSGVGAGLPTTSDFIFDMIYAMSAAYRSGAAFIGSGATIASVRKFKDANGNYVWQPSLVLGTPSTLGGYEILEVEDMPAVAANAYPLAFANLKEGYLIADRIGIRTLRDPYTHKPFVHFYATKRVGGMVQNTKAFVLLQAKV